MCRSGHFESDNLTNSRNNKLPIKMFCFTENTRFSQKDGYNYFFFGPPHPLGKNLVIVSIDHFWEDHFHLFIFDKQMK